MSRKIIKQLKPTTIPTLYRHCMTPCTIETFVQTHSEEFWSSKEQQTLEPLEPRKEQKTRLISELNKKHRSKPPHVWMSIPGGVLCFVDFFVHSKEHSLNKLCSHNSIWHIKSNQKSAVTVLMAVWVLPKLLVDASSSLSDQSIFISHTDSKAFDSILLSEILYFSDYSFWPLPAINLLPTTYDLQLTVY